MDRLLSLSGGQPLRTTDWEFIQNVTEVLIKSILKGLLPSETAFIVSGMEVNIAGTAEVTEGYFFDGTEICYVPAASFTENEAYHFYMTPDVSTSENRTFKDTTTHDVWQLRRYVVGYGATTPGGSITLNSFPLIKKLTDLINSSINISSAFRSAYNLSYVAGFAGATSYNSVSLQENDLSQRMILAAFNSDYTQGKLTTLPAGHRPTGDVVGFFFNGSTSPGILKIRKNGEVWVSGASTVVTNYISFQFGINFLDPVLWGLPTIGGGAPPDGDISR